MRLIHLNWSFVTGEGSVSYTKNFNEAHFVDQLDMLQDCIVDLTDKYNSLLAPNAAAPEASYGFPHGAVSAPKAGGSGLTAGETAPTRPNGMLTVEEVTAKKIDPNQWAFDRGLEST